jgi:putative exporter of polyketide antibiotics
VASNGAALGKEKLDVAGRYKNFIHKNLLVGHAMTLWDTTMITLAVAAIIAFCFWARTRADESDGKDSQQR